MTFEYTDPNHVPAYTVEGLDADMLKVENSKSPCTNTKVCISLWYLVCGDRVLALGSRRSAA